MKKNIQVALLFIASTIPGISFAESFGAESTSSNVKPLLTKPAINREAWNSRVNAKDAARKDISIIKIGVSTSTKDSRIGARENIKDARYEFRDKTMSVRASSTLSREEKMSDVMSNLKDKREEIKQIREDNMKKIEEIRDIAQKIILERKNELKVELKKIKDDKKVKIVESSNDKLVQINNNRTDHFLSVLNHLEDVLVNIKERIKSAESKGVNVSSATKAVIEAEKAIASSRNIVNGQVSKIYPITITTENNLKNDVGNSVKKLQNDLNQTMISVKNAHDAVRKAAVALAKSMGVDFPKISSSSSVNSSIASSSPSSLPITSSSSAESSTSTSSVASTSSSI